MSKQESEAAKHRVLVNLDEEARARIDELASKLGDCGLEGIEVFSLGGVIAGEGSSEVLSKVRRLKGVASVEVEPSFRAI